MGVGTPAKFIVRLSLELESLVGMLNNEWSWKKKGPKFIKEEPQTITTLLYY